MRQDVLSPEQAVDIAAWWRTAFEALREQESDSPTWMPPHGNEPPTDKTAKASSMTWLRALLQFLRDVGRGLESAWRGDDHVTPPW